MLKIGYWETNACLTFDSAVRISPKKMYINKLAAFVNKTIKKLRKITKLSLEVVSETIISSKNFLL